MTRDLWMASAVALLCALSPLAADAQPLEDPGHAATDGLTHSRFVGALDQGNLSIRQARQLGLLVFSTPFNQLDGFGEGPFDPDEPDAIGFGHRPSLQGNGTFLRVNGLDAQSCNECHSIVSHRTLPPTIGIGGVGGGAQNAIIQASLIDVADTFDHRVTWVSGHDPDMPMVRDGVADYNGRFSNPPFLFGGGGVEALGKEMTAKLQGLLGKAKAAPAGAVISLDAKGVNFGTVTSLGGGDVEIDNRGIDQDLVVRPFGRKGERFSNRDFSRAAMQFHFGIQPNELVGAGVDEDGDGHVDEITDGEMSALHFFAVNNPVPRYVPYDGTAGYGFRVFASVGCSSCHIPSLQTDSKYLPLAHPEVANDPSANVYYDLNLKRVGFPKASSGGVSVPLFADLKRHDMGPRLAETFEAGGGHIPNEHFTTARLWGVADTAPYLHDGRALTLEEAIEYHGGEAQGVRDAFFALSRSDQEALMSFLLSLRVPKKPNEDLLPLQ